jgi:hypothetical protein
MPRAMEAIGARLASSEWEFYNILWLLSQEA